MRLPIQVAFVPRLKVAATGPIRNKPEFIVVPFGADNVQSNKARCGIHEMRAASECCCDLGRHRISYCELAQGYEHADIIMFRCLGQSSSVLLCLLNFCVLLPAAPVVAFLSYLLVF